MNLATITNATKAQIIVVINALMALLVEFGVNLSDRQMASIMLFVNALLALYVGLTYTKSVKRVPN